MNEPDVDTSRDTQPARKTTQIGSFKLVDDLGIQASLPSGGRHGALPLALISSLEYDLLPYPAIDSQEIQDVRAHFHVLGRTDGVILPRVFLVVEFLTTKAILRIPASNELLNQGIVRPLNSQSKECVFSLERMGWDAIAQDPLPG